MEYKIVKEVGGVMINIEDLWDSYMEIIVEVF